MRGRQLAYRGGGHALVGIIASSGRDIFEGQPWFYKTRSMERFEGVSYQLRFHLLSRSSRGGQQMPERDSVCELARFHVSRTVRTREWVVRLYWEEEERAALSRYHDIIIEAGD